MRRRATTLVGLLVVVLAIWLVARDFHPPRAIGRPASPEAADGGADRDGLLFAYADAAVAGEGGAFFSGDLSAQDVHLDAGVGTTLLDGTPVPPLPPTAPRQVRFGVVLVSYSGAQASEPSARAARRTHGEARMLAAKLLNLAREDFRAAVQQGDAGSADDVGWMKLGVLEPAPEYVLFTLPVDGVGGPVDTPRGLWIVKRLE
ncbi:MAG: hypothetical protein ABSC94_08175 [Polyangiaceae bacterium]|jgi:hypothetical protein